MTHDELVARAARWLRNTERCSLVLVEPQGMIERPDVIGFSFHGSIMVEAKISRSDFRRDLRKISRHPLGAEYGYGQRRYYIVTPHLLEPDEIPEQWGLLYAYPRIIKRVKPAQKLEYIERMLWRERCLLFSEFANYLRNGGLSKSRRVQLGKHNSSPIDD